MALDTRNPEEIRRDARRILSSGKGPREAWGELSSWAAGRGPAAAKGAAVEFLAAHGRNPEAAALMPEIMRSVSSLPFDERLALVHHMRDRAAQMRLPPQMPAIQRALPLAGPRPAAITSFGPVRGPIGPGLRPEPRPPSPAISPAISQARARPEFLRPQRFDSSKSPDTVAMGANKGERLVRTLVQRVRSHGFEGASYQSAPLQARKQSPSRPALIQKKSASRKSRTSQRNLPRRKAKAHKAVPKKRSKSGVARKPARKRAARRTGSVKARRR